MQIGKYLEICFGWGLMDWQLRDCRLHFAPPTSQMGTLPKAFQTNTTCLFGFFIAHPLNQASLFRVFAIKKPPICMGGFVANIGASLEEFAGDVRAILELTINNK